MLKRSIICTMISLFCMAASACATVPTDVEFQPRPIQEFSENDQQQIRCLAENVYHEARGESVEGQFAVAMVVRNRLDEGFADDWCGVVWQRSSRRHCQFSWTCDGRSDRIRDQKTFDTIFELMTVFYQTNPVDMIDGAQYYHTRHVRPRWSRAYVQTAQIGAHIFFRG